MPRPRLIRSTAFCSTVSVFRPRKSNFTRPAASTIFQLNWVTGMFDLRIAVERHQLLERPVADHHAGGVRGGVAIEAFELLGDLQQARDHRLAVALLLQLGLAVDGLRQRDGIGRVVRHQLAQPVDLPIGHLQHAADVAQHGARLQLAVRDDLRDAVVRRTSPARSGSPRRAGPGRSRCRSRASTRARGSGSARTAGRSAADRGR